MKIILFNGLYIFLLSSCTSYNIPIQTDSHPADPNASVFLIQLSSILDIDPIINGENDNASSKD